MPRAQIPTYDGKIQWAAYFSQFEVYTDGLPHAQKLKLLVLALHHHALQYYSGLSPSVRISYALLVDCMDKRFGQKEPVSMICRQLQDLNNCVDESVKELGQGTWDMANQAHGEHSEIIAEQIAIDAFLKTCSNKPAALAVMSLNPSSLDDAIYRMKAQIHSQQLLGFSSRNHSVRSVSFQPHPTPVSHPENMTNDWQHLR